MSIRYLPTEARSALRAGEMQRRHRQRGSGDVRAVPDFLTGAHALMQCSGLITRDDRFYRDYFKGLKLIVPAVADGCATTDPRPTSARFRSPPASARVTGRAASRASAWQ